MRLISCRGRIGAAAFFGATAAAASEVLHSTTTRMNPPVPPTPLPSGISVRQAAAEEAHPLLTNMINDAFRHYHPLYAKDLSLERVTPDGQQVVTLMKKPCNTFLVAEETKDDDSKSVVGCVHVCWSGETDSDDGDVDAHFGMLSVAKGCSGRGIGKLLVSAAEERCRKELRRKELRRKEIVMEISIAGFFPGLMGWYETQGYRKKKSIPFPMPELVREGCEFELELMTKTIPLRQ